MLEELERARGERHRVEELRQELAELDLQRTEISRRATQVGEELERHPCSGDGGKGSGEAETRARAFARAGR